MPTQSDDGRVTVAAKRYGQLVAAIGDRLGYRRGWKTQAAKRLGVHPSFISKVSHGQVTFVGVEVLRKAVEAFRGEIDLSFFDGVGPDIGAESVVMEEDGRLESSGEILRGSVVKLKSGGPDMTVFDPDYHDNYSTWSYPRGVLCVWFVGDEVNRDVFPRDALKVVR